MKDISSQCLLSMAKKQNQHISIRENIDSVPKQVQQYETVGVEGVRSKMNKTTNMRLRTNKS